MAQDDEGFWEIINMEKIRNFCIIAHVDHGKSTLADRLLEITGTIDKRNMKDQLLDQMDLEREKGITIKLQPVRMNYQGYILNLIDTPGHVDFSYEVSRSLAAVEGAVLLVDATQGIQAQTLANFQLAKEQGLTIIPVINKIDLPAANVPEALESLEHLTGVPKENILKVSGKTGEGVRELLDQIIENCPPPDSTQNSKLKTQNSKLGIAAPSARNDEAPFQALIFDSIYDDYRGVVAYVRVFGGALVKGQEIFFHATGAKAIVLEVGTFSPKLTPKDKLLDGEIGYIVTGLKSIKDCRVGDTISLWGDKVEALHGYKPSMPMVFASIFSRDGEATKLRTGIEKLQLNDASLSFEPERSDALGYGFRCGFLGLLHLDIIQERLRREFDLDLIVTVPSVAYHIKQYSDKEFEIVTSPLHLPKAEEIADMAEPWVALEIITPSAYIGNITKLLAQKNAFYITTEYLDAERAIMKYETSLASILVDFYDALKSASSGYASLAYQIQEYKTADIVRLDILVAGEIVEALSSLVNRSEAQHIGRKVVEELKKVLPRQMFEIKIQASIGGKIIASEHLPAMRKDVTAKLYGGDRTRRMKLLEKQKKGKSRMKAMGKVDLPPEAFWAVLKR